MFETYSTAFVRLISSTTLIYPSAHFEEKKLGAMDSDKPHGLRGGSELLPITSVRAYHRTKGIEYFRVHWTGYTKEESTWEVLEHLNAPAQEMAAAARSKALAKASGTPQSGQERRGTSGEAEDRPVRGIPPPESGGKVAAAAGSLQPPLWAEEDTGAPPENRDRRRRRGNDDGTGGEDDEDAGPREGWGQEEDEEELVHVLSKGSRHCARVVLEEGPGAAGTVFRSVRRALRLPKTTGSLVLPPKSQQTWRDHPAAAAIDADRQVWRHALHQMQICGPDRHLSSSATPTGSAIGCLALVRC